MRSKICITIMLLVLSYSNLASAVMLVPEEVSTIQAAIVKAEAGDTVLVAPGRYYENINLLGKAITLSSNYLVTGNRSFINNTIIDGSRPHHPDTASVILMVNGESASTIISGFTITGGTGTVWKDEHGAGTYREGGGILMNGSTARICNNRIINNHIENIGNVISTGGGAIRCGDGNPEIYHNIFTGNYARYGGGIVLNYSGANIHNNLFYKNGSGDAYSGGAAIWAYGPNRQPKLITNNTVTENFSPNSSPAISMGDTAVLSNNIIWDNYSSSDKQIATPYSGQVIKSYNIISGIDTASNPRLAWIGEDSLGVLRGSPAIDAGNPSPDANDLDGSRNDIGYQGGPAGVIFPYPVGAYDVSAPFSETYLVPGRDSVLIKVNIHNPDSESILPELTYSDRSGDVNTLTILHDDGINGDNRAGDGMYTAWFRAPAEETTFQLGIRVKNLETRTYAYQKVPLRYSTIGPVDVLGLHVHNDDPTFLPGAVIRFSPILVNRGDTASVYDVTSQAETVKGGTMGITSASYGDIPAGDTVTTSNFSILPIPAEYPMGSEIVIAFHISSGNHEFWHDTLTVLVGTNPVGVKESHYHEGPKVSKLNPNTPNPFNPSTTINYYLAYPGEAKLTVYDATGRSVATLIDSYQPAGHHLQRWDGVDVLGQPVSAGVYLARLDAGSYSRTIKMVYLK